MSNISVNDLIRHIFRIKNISVYEENLARYTGVRRRTTNRIADAHKSPYIVPIPDPKNVSLEEAIRDAVEIVRKEAENKRICLLWSGGIDSTLVFYALVEAKIPFIVFMDGNSRNEYELVYNDIVNRKYDFVDYKLFSPRGVIDLLEECADPNNLFVTGEIGDQLTGSMITMRYPYEERNMLMKDIVEKDWFCRPYTKEEVRHVFRPVLADGLNGTQLAIKHVEKTIYDFLGTTPETTTLSEFLWGLNFIFKYMLVMLRLYQVGLYFEGDNKNTVHFFNTEKFQQWSMWNYKENCAYVKETDYKMPFKEWIYKCNNDAEYRDNKLKVPSLKISFYYDERREP